MRHHVCSAGFWSGLLLLLILTGCAGLGRPLQKAEVSLVDLQVKEVRPLEAVLTLSLRVMNPNDKDLKITGINCRMKVDGHDFATGMGNALITVPAYGTAVVPVTVYASTLRMFSSVLAMLQENSPAHSAARDLGYELEGTIRLADSVTRSLDFSGRGSLSLPGPDGAR